MSQSSVTPEGLVTEAVMSKGLVPMETETENKLEALKKITVKIFHNYHKKLHQGGIQTLLELKLKLKVKSHKGKTKN